MSQDSTAGYIRHAELFGPEYVVETAARDLTAHKLSELKAFIDSKQRTHRWRNARWEERRQVVRTCERCGLDLPRGARGNQRFHPHCQRAAAQARWRARQAQTTKDTGSS